MPKTTVRHLAALLLLAYAHAATAGGCNDLPDTASALACYRTAAQAGQEDQGAKALIVSRNHSLANEWAPSNDPLNAYKQTYFLFYSHSSRRNDAPTSPNPANRVPYAYALDDKEMKFQLSIKSHIVGAGRHALWAGYTQLSFWQVYDTAHSNPFRESNYEPELIYSYRPERVELGGFRAAFVNAAFVHQSNGQSLPRSRSWNRATLQLGAEREFEDGHKLALLLRGWKHLWRGGPEDDNEDITHFLGHGDLEARYHLGRGSLSALLRSRAIQLDLALPVSSLLRNANLHLQYFNGYGESLIDYNHGHTSFGIGLSMPLR